MIERGDGQQELWRPLVVRGVPVHVVAPAGLLVVGLALLASGGISSVVGAWVLTAGFPLAVGAFVSDARALAAPAVVWALWLVVARVAGEGSSLPRTPVLLAAVLAGLGAAAVWLAQRAVLPAVEGAELEQPHARSELPDVDALLAAPVPPPVMDASVEVDEALADLLAEPMEASVSDGVDASDEEDGGADQPDPTETHAQAEVEVSPEEAGDAAPSPRADELDEGGHVIEFEAIRED